MQKTVRKRPDHQSCDSDESESGKQRVTGSENFCRIRMERIDRAHPAQNHGSVQKRINPAQASNLVVSNHANA
jgi:hypothetical protein